jgi:hypothetical protein
MNVRRINWRILIGLNLILFSCAIYVTTKVQRQQTFFETYARRVISECDHAYDFQHKLRESVDHAYIQNLIQEASSLSDYPESFNSKVFFDEKENQQLVDDMWDKVTRLGTDQLKASTK